MDQQSAAYRKLLEAKNGVAEAVEIARHALDDVVQERKRTNTAEARAADLEAQLDALREWWPMTEKPETPGQYLLYCEQDGGVFAVAHYPRQWQIYDHAAWVWQHLNPPDGSGVGQETAAR